MPFEFQNFCSELHSSHSDNFPCMGSYLSICFGIILLGNFFNIQRKIFSNFKRAVAGYTANTVSIETHVALLNYVAIWALVWGLYELFNVSDPTGSMDITKASREAQSLITCIVYAGASFLEANLLFLLISNSFGQKDFLFAFRIAMLWAVVVFLALAVVFFFKKGHERDDLPYENVGAAIAGRDFATIIMQLIGWLYSMKTAPDRNSIHRFILLMVVTYSFLMIGRILGLSANHEANEVGLCLRDAGHVVYFSFFANVCYITLKRDSQYWTFDDNISSKLTAEDTFGQMSNYKDVVIPKTELYYRKRITGGMDLFVDIFLWRRQYVVVKKFEYDLLTKDNIKFFKQEANAFRHLDHANIVKFLGVVVDPPCLGIVMEYCPKGDLLGYLRELRSSGTRSLSVVSGSSSGLHTPTRSSDIGSHSYRENTITSISEISANNGLEAITMEHFSIASKSIDHNGNNQLTPVVEVKKSEEGNDDDIRVTAVEPERLVSALSSSSSTPTPSRLKHRPTTGRSSLSMLLSSSPSSSSTTSPTPLEPIFDPLEIATQIAQGMEYLHKGNNIHRDLKSGNVLLDNGLVGKIADFGDSCSNIDSSRTLSSASSANPMGTPGWSAPELNSLTSDSSVDVYSFGIILWELLTWLPPTLLISQADARRYAGLIESPSSTASGRHSSVGGKFGGSLDISSSLLMSSPKRTIPPSPSTTTLSDPLISTDQESDDRSSSAIIDRKSASLDQEVGRVTRRPRDKTVSTIHVDSDLASSPTNVIPIEVSKVEISEIFVTGKRYRPPLPLRTPARMINLLKMCWASEPKIRPTFTEILVELKEIRESAVIRLDMYPFEISSIVNEDTLTTEILGRKNKKAI